MTAHQFRHIRTEVLHLTQRQLADRLGRSRSTVDKIESGQLDISRPIAVHMDDLCSLFARERARHP